MSKRKRPLTEIEKILLGQGKARQSFWGGRRRSKTRGVPRKMRRDDD